MISSSSVSSSSFSSSSISSNSRNLSSYKLGDIAGQFIRGVDVKKVNQSYDSQHGDVT